MVSFQDPSDFARLNTVMLNACDILMATMLEHIFPSGQSAYSVQLFLRNITNPITVLTGLTHAQARDALDALNRYKRDDAKIGEVAELFDKFATPVPVAETASAPIQAPPGLMPLQGVSAQAPVQVPTNYGGLSPGMREIVAYLRDVPSAPPVEST